MTKFSDWIKVCSALSDGKVKLLLEKDKKVFTKKLGTMTQHMAKLHLKGTPNQSIAGITCLYEKNFGVNLQRI